LKKIGLGVLALSIVVLIAACGGGSAAVNNTPTTTTTPIVQATPSVDMDKPVTIAVIGDMPYGTSPTDTAQFTINPAFITAINNDVSVSVVLHAGDIHSGKEYCTEAYDRSIFNQWSAFKAPVIYTPGDNEWSDCHKVKQGGGRTTFTIDYQSAGGNLLSYAGGDPVTNLQLVRSIFFANPGKSLGINAVALHSQAKEFDPAYPSDSAYVENVWWMQSKVLFVTMNIPGGSNNDNDIWYATPQMSPVQSQEITNRTEANKRWLDTAFKQAAANGAIAVVIQEQGDMWDLDGNFTLNAASQNHIYQYKQFIDKIAANTTAFGKPVLLFNGDAHVYRSDNPLKAAAPCVVEPSSGMPAVACSATTVSATYGNGSSDAYVNQPNGYNVPNFHRVTVHGSTKPLEYLKLTIDPKANATNGADAFGPFSWKRVQPAL
jgi:hypothetical protein